MKPPKPLKRTPLKRSTTPIRKRRAKPRRGRIIDADYKAWIASLPCLICGILGVEVAHVGDRGLSQKCHDKFSVPLCPYHHRDSKAGKDGQLGRNWWDHHGLNREEVFAILHANYESLGKKLKAA